MSDVFTLGRRPDRRNGWESVRIKDVCTYVNRGVAPTYATGNTGVIAFSQKCVLNDGRVASALGRPMEDHGEVLTDARLRPKDIVINSTGTGTLGRTGILGEEDDEPAVVAVADGHVTVVRANVEGVVPEFLAQLLGTDAFMRFANECMAVGSTNQMELGRETLRTLGLRIPPLEEQRRLVQYLSDETTRIDALMHEQLQSIELLWERRRASVFDAVTGRSVPGPRRPGLPWVDSIPSEWSTAKLTSVASLGSGHTPARSRPELWQDCTIPWITTGEVWQIRSDEAEVLTETRELISQLGVDESSAVLHPAGTVVLSRTASAGFSAIMGKDMATSQDFATCRAVPTFAPSTCCTA